MSFGTTELNTYVHLRNLLDSFQKRTLNYCSSGVNEQERSARVDEIRHALTGTGAFPAPVNLATDCPLCDVNEHCERGACVPDTADSGMAAEISPQVPNNSPQDANSCLQPMKS